MRKPRPSRGAGMNSQPDVPGRRGAEFPWLRGDAERYSRLGGRLSSLRRAYVQRVFFCLVIVIAILAAPAVASAHAVLASSQPQAG